MNVFTYGSLMFARVWNAVVSGCYQSNPGQVDGLSRVCVKNETYPAVVSAAKGRPVRGRLYFNVNQVDLRRLDRFEGDYYQRQMVNVSLENGVSVEAAVYVFKDEYRHLLAERDWDEGWFAAEGLELFLKHYNGFT